MRYIILIMLSIFSNCLLASNHELLNNKHLSSKHQKSYRYTIDKIRSMPHLTNQDYEQKFLIIIDNKTQQLFLYDPNGRLLKSYTISTSKKGLGQLSGSRQTPMGLHRIAEKIGNNVPHYGIFRARQFTQKIWQKSVLQRKDFIVTRILSLEGLEPGINRGKNNHGQVVDSLRRGIYIHGTTMDWKLGTPSTIGCVHLNSYNLVELFDLVPIHSLVMIY